jgi:tetratricopeptide (TPR) repeat protein
MTRARFIAAALVGLVAGLTACADVRVDRRVVDEQLLAALGLAQSYQHEADELEAAGDRAQALARVRQVLEIPFPEGAPESEDVRLDAWGRAAELQLADGDHDGAEETVRRGLAEATRTSYFKARLHAVRGRILRARAELLRAAGRDEEGRQVGREAIEAFEQSIAINREVLGMDQGRDADRGD